jgi:Right handed beta helix region
MSFKRQYLAAMAVGFLATLPAAATSSHTWVAGYGNDANPCSVTQPCATFTAAHTATSAGGVISVLSPGDFGAVTISKSITIDGGAIGGNITFTGGEGIYISAGTSDTVILRHLTVNGLNAGQDAIYLYQARYLVIEDCDVEGFVSIGLGFGSQSAANVTVTNTRIIGGQLGVRTFQSNGGVAYDIISMRHVVVSGASSAAVFSRNGTMEISDSLITQSSIGVEADTNAFINVANSVISNNGTDEEFFPGTTGGIFVASNNTLFGNNGVPGPPAGPAVVSSPQVVIRSNSPLPPDAPRPPRR